MIEGTCLSSVLLSLLALRKRLNFLLPIDELIAFTSETPDENSPDAITDPTAIIDADDDNEEIITSPRVQACVKLAATICACNF